MHLNRSLYTATQVPKLSLDDAIKKTCLNGHSPARLACFDNDCIQQFHAANPLISMNFSLKSPNRSFAVADYSGCDSL